MLADLFFFRRSEYSRCFRSGTCFVALLCTLSNSAISVFLYGAHTATDVSMSGRTRLLKSWRNIFWSRLSNVLRMIPITALAFFILVYMWSLKLRLSSTWTPISFSHVVASSLTWFADPSSEFVTMLKFGGVSSSLYPNDNTLHLSGWNWRSQSDDHLHKQSRSSGNFFYL